MSSGVQAGKSGLYDIGLRAYSRGYFDEAANYFLQTIDEEPDNWEARLYLAMSCHRIEQVYQAMEHLKFIVEYCPIDDYVVKASLALAAIKVEASYPKHKRKKEQNDPDEITWIG